MKDRQTRELLKPSDYESRMKRVYKAESILYAIVAVVSIVLILLGGGLTSYMLNNNMLFHKDDKAFNVIRALLLTVGLGYFLLAFFVSLRLMLKAVGENSAVTRGEYNIVLDTFLHEAREVRLRSFRERLFLAKSTIESEEVYYFENSGRYVLTPRDNNLRTYSMSGDPFYVFTLKKDPSKPILIYNARVYEIRECDSREYNLGENII